MHTHTYNTQTWSSQICHAPTISMCLLGKLDLMAIMVYQVEILVHDLCTTGVGSSDWIGVFIKMAEVWRIKEVSAGDTLLKGKRLILDRSNTLPSPRRWPWWQRPPGARPPSPPTPRSHPVWSWEGAHWCVPLSALPGRSSSGWTVHRWTGGRPWGSATVQMPASPATNTHIAYSKFNNSRPCYIHT